MREAAQALRLTADDLYKLGVCDRIIPEPRGGAQRDPAGTIQVVGKALQQMLEELDGKSAHYLRSARRQKYLELGSKGLAA